MDFKGAKLGDVFKIFSQQSGLNFIASTEASEKTINLYFDKVPVQEALDRILSANNLTYELKPGSNIFVVKENPPEGVKLMTRIYKLKHASVPSSKINSTFSSSDSDSGSSSGGEKGTTTSGIIDSIEKLLSENGSAVEDTRTNSIIVTDIPTRFDAIENTIARLDVKIPQILIEVEMMDISKQVLDELGARWGNTPVQLTAGGTKQTTFPFEIDNILDDGYSYEDPEYTSGTISFAGLNFTLNFLKTNTDAKALARPRILTLNNETAKIYIKTDEAIGISATSAASSNPETTSTTVSQAERVETGVFLTVTPQANVETREITMAVQPRVIQATQGETLNNQEFKDPEERSVQTMLRVKDGETIVIGGLLKTNFSSIKTTVPVLSKIPFFGAAFRHKEEDDDQRELIIFITPNIVEETAYNDAFISKSFLREQDIPFSEKITPLPAVEKKPPKQSMLFNKNDNRLDLIDKELSAIENQGF